MTEWTQVGCAHCGGHGLVQGPWSALAGDGPDECRFCNGNGAVWRSPKGRLASYPGGPFIGRDDDRPMRQKHQEARS
jgi:hypothetical protein